MTASPINPLTGRRTYDLDRRDVMPCHGMLPQKWSAAEWLCTRLAMWWDPDQGWSAGAEGAASAGGTRKAAEAGNRTGSITDTSGPSRPASPAYSREPGREGNHNRPAMPNTRELLNSAWRSKLPARHRDTTTWVARPCGVLCARSNRCIRGESNPAWRVHSRSLSSGSAELFRAFTLRLAVCVCGACRARWRQNRRHRQRVGVR